MILATAKDTDLETIYQLIQATIDTCYPPFYPPRAVAAFKYHHSREAVIQRLRYDLVLMAKEGDRLIGTGSLVDNEISGLFVLPDVQSKGVGSVLMKELEDRAGQLDIDMVELDVSLPSRAFYEHLGYSGFKERFLDVGEDQYLNYWHVSKRLGLVSLSRDDDTFDLEGKKFVARENSGNGEVSAQTLFEYHQKDDLIWATYSGGDIVHGQLLGLVVSRRSFISRYQHLNKLGALMTGKCETRISKDAQGGLQLNEIWEWTSGDLSYGTSVLVEAKSC